MSSTSSKNSLRVAILGGGLAGAVLCRGLSRYSHLSVSIFESAPAFRAQGLGIGLNTKAIWALELLGLKDCVSDAGAVPMTSSRAVIGQGTDQGKVVLELNHPEGQTWIVQRANLLEQILKNADQERMFAGKKLASLEQKEVEQEIVLHFDDNTSHVCDVLIGCDGVHSQVRNYVLGSDSSSSEQSFAGWWTAWTVKPYEQAVKHLDRKFLDLKHPHQYGWIAPGAFVLHDILSNKTMVQCAISQRVAEDSMGPDKQWMKEVTKVNLQSMLKGCHPHLNEGMVNLFSEGEEKIPMMAMWHHQSTPNFVKGAVAIAGDAAGATTPWQSSGGGMSMQDAFLISELFRNTNTVGEAKAALLAYEHVNKPRREEIIRSSYEVGLLMSGVYQNVEMDSNKIREELLHRWDYIFDVDLLKLKDDALQAMQGIAVRQAKAL